MLDDDFPWSSEWFWVLCCLRQGPGWNGMCQNWQRHPPNWASWLPGEQTCWWKLRELEATSCNPTMWSFKTCYSILIYCLKTAVGSSSAPGTKNGVKSTMTAQREGGRGSHNTVLSWCISIRVISFLAVLVVQYTATTSTWEAFFAFMRTNWDSVCLRSTGRHTESATCSYLYGGMVDPGGLKVSLVFMVC